MRTERSRRSLRGVGNAIAARVRSALKTTFDSADRVDSGDGVAERVANDVIPVLLRQLAGHPAGNAIADVNQVAGGREAGRRD